MLPAVSCKLALSSVEGLSTAHATSACAKFLDFLNLLFYYVKADIKKPSFELYWLILD